jgi:hypothetical protein
MVAGSNQGGLTIPVNYIYDQAVEDTEWAWFNISSPGQDGASLNWVLGDPTCDNSFKSDGAVYTITNLNPTATPTNTATNTATPTKTFTITKTPSATVAEGVIPSTDNPTINNTLGGVRIIANPSFESGSKVAFPCESQMAGWYTSHPIQSSCRVFELWGSGLTNVESVSGVTPPHGAYYIELNAYNSSIAYQPICMVGGETFEFEFYHHTRSWSSTNEIQFRFGIPSGLDAGSKSNDSYSRVVVQGVNTLGGSGSTATISLTNGQDTSDTGYEINAAPKKNWVRIYGTHTIPGDFGGIRNLGFYGIQPSGGSANLLDNINIDLKPVIDMGTSRDSTGVEGNSPAPAPLNIRINGKISAGTQLVLNLDNGNAVPDTDFTIGEISAGANGTATITHTVGTNSWIITVPPGYYDGGMVAGSNQGGLAIPVNYIYDQAAEATEWAWFNISSPGQDGASLNWVLGDPTCDNSFKSDGAVYTITNLNPTATPTSTATNTSTPTLTYTPSKTLTPSRTPSRTFEPGIIPTTGNPTINNSIAGVRSMANTSFEEYTGCATNPPSVYHLLPPLTGVFGWKTTQPAGQVR